MSRITVRAAAVVTLAALFTGSAVSAGYAASPAPDAPPPTPIESPSGNYIVLLDEKPVATYDGGQPGLAPTKPDEGQKLDAQAPEVKQYQRFLAQRQDAVARETGVQPQATYQTTLNGFSAKMSPEEAAKVAASKGVLGVYPDEIRHPDAVPSTQFLGLEGDSGVWNRLGGTDGAGKGVVVGVVDTGIAPENRSFAGNPLGTAPGTEPYLAGNDVVFTKGDGTDFRSARVSGDQWSADAYSTKLVGAKYFSSGAAATGFDFQYDILSPRDGAGHGSHTASTAAGNSGVPASVGGVDFGTISGVAPAAKVAAYKACYEGPDPADNTDDICALSDLLDAIDAAVADGVDVINYSIGGGSASSVLAPDDVSFLNAAAAGVFVAVSAGNSGPGASTADHASPWYTTVAASTIPTYEGTVRLPNGFEAVGDTVTVPFGQSITGPVVYAGDIAAPGASSANAALCLPSSIDPAKAATKIVVCDRGTNARAEKSEVVKAAGGIGMILVNVTPNSLDNDFHAVPTIHIDSTHRTDLLAYVRTTADATATLVSGNKTNTVTPTPVVAGFSSRGPMLAGGSDVLKPDISAPGVAILAATNNPAGQTPTYGFLSGTSMSSPHIAGLAALYLGERPKASPAEIKSAMMTTAYDTVNGDGSPNTDPFAQGAGHVDPTKYLDTGLLYLNGPSDWAAYIQGQGLADLQVEPIDASQLNLASIAIGTLSKPETITRTVTATRPGIYTVDASIPGVDVVVSPTTLTFDEAGQAKPFEVTFTNRSAAVEQWATGFLTWTGEDGSRVRSPLAVQPVTADAPASVSGTGITGSTDVTIDAGITGELPLNLSGLAPVELLTDPTHPVPGHSGDQSSGDADKNVTWTLQVPEGATLAQFTLDSSDDTGSDLDLFVYRIVSPTDPRYYERWSSATGSADEQVSLANPTPGYYMVVANVYATTRPMTWDLTSAVVTPGGVGSLTATPNPLPVTQGQPATYTLSWTGLQAATKYRGVVGYGDSAVRTVLTVDSGPAAPVATAPPVVSGTPKVGKTLTATPGTWDPADVQVAYQWLRAGQPIAGATAATYKVTKDDVGSALSVKVTATATGNPNVGTATSNEVFVKYTSKTKVTMNRYLGTSSQNYAVTVAVTPSGGEPASGDVSVWVGSKKYTGTLSGGAVTIDLPKQSRGVHVVVVSYPGSATVEESTGVSAFLVLR
ncbi:S8 family serine peptidase [Microbacterium sp. CJ88]|uniref:S8 family serine peptidase n=1 Tax=Microbacterium sp. CJ88 TaxID=3445672 RepID=UPI003F65AC84